MTDPDLNEFEFTFTVRVTQFCGVIVTAYTQREALAQFNENWGEYVAQADVYDESKPLLDWDSLEVDGEPLNE